MLFDYKIIDDFIPIKTQEEIKEVFLTPEHAYPWFYNPDITYGNESKAKNPAFSSIIKPSNPLVQVLARDASEIAECKMHGIVQARAFLQLPLNPNFMKASVDALHVDLDMKHLVVLYYVLDSDGDTILVNKKLKDGEDIKTDLHVKDYDIMARVKPKQGRVILFDGRIYHTAMQPIYHVRCVINIDVAYGDL